MDWLFQVAVYTAHGNGKRVIATEPARMGGKELRAIVTMFEREYPPDHPEKFRVVVKRISVSITEIVLDLRLLNG